VITPNAYPMAIVTSATRDPNRAYILATARSTRPLSAVRLDVDSALTARRLAARLSRENPRGESVLALNRALVHLASLSASTETDGHCVSNASFVTPTLLIVDDHQGFRTFARTLLDGDGFEVTGEAEDGETALDLVSEQRPDVVLLDVQLPGIDGFEVAERLAASADPPAVVLTSTRDAADYGRRLTTAPILGFVPKQELSGTTVSALLSPTPGVS
jgi:CheY-like chemotaxis protein